MTESTDRDRSDRQNEQDDEPGRGKIGREDEPSSEQPKRQDQNVFRPQSMATNSGEPKIALEDLAHDQLATTKTADNTTNRDDSDAKDGTSADKPSIEHSAAAVHRELSDAGVRLNEAHAHLSTLRTASTDDSEAATEITQAEAEALLETLLEGRDELLSAIEHAKSIAQDANVGVEDIESSRRSSDDGDKMLWNTAGPQRE